MPKAQAIQINWQFTGSAGIMQVEHTACRKSGTTTRHISFATDTSLINHLQYLH